MPTPDLHPDTIWLIRQMTGPQTLGVQGADEVIDPTLRGRPVARLTAANKPRKRIDASLLEAVTAISPSALAI